MRPGLWAGTLIIRTRTGAFRRLGNCSSAGSGLMFSRSTAWAARRVPQGVAASEDRLRTFRGTSRANLRRQRAPRAGGSSSRTRLIALWAAARTWRLLVWRHTALQRPANRVHGKVSRGRRHADAPSESVAPGLRRQHGDGRSFRLMRIARRFPRFFVRLYRRA